MPKTVLFIILVGSICGGQTEVGAASCPIDIVKIDPSHESVWNNMSTMRTYGNTTVSAHNKFLQVKFKNRTPKTVRGIKLVGAYYDSTEDLHTLPESWGWHGNINPGEVKGANWDNNLWQGKAVIGWVIAPLKVLFEDGTKWTPADPRTCMAEWWKNKKHPRINQAPDFNGVSMDND